MDVDALLELLGIRARKAESKVGPDGQYLQPASEREAGRQEIMSRINSRPEPTDNLMEIISRNARRPGIGEATSPQPVLDSVASNINYTTADAGQVFQQQEHNLSEEARRLRDLEATIAQQQEAQQRRVALNPPWESIQHPVLGRSPQPQEPPAPQASAPLPTPTRAPIPSTPTPPPSPFPPNAPRSYPYYYGPPLRNLSSDEPPPVPQPRPQNAGTNQPTLPVPLPTMLSGGSSAPAGPINPFMDENGQQPQLPAFLEPPAPITPITPPYLPGAPDPRRQFPNSVPFVNPLAGVDIAFPQAGGEQSQQSPSTPPQPFMPQGALIDWWNSRRTAPAPTPNQPAPIPPDQSTILNQQELQRFLTANSGGSAPPPAVNAQSPTPASVPAMQPANVPSGATPMSEPAPGNQITPALKEQLLQEAYRLVANRNKQQPALGPR